jgi:hypothetical protein
MVALKVTGSFTNDPAGSEDARETDVLADPTD